MELEALEAIFDEEFKRNLPPSAQPPITADSAARRCRTAGGGRAHTPGACFVL